MLRLPVAFAVCLLAGGSAAAQAPPAPGEAAPGPSVEAQPSPAEAFDAKARAKELYNFAMADMAAARYGRAAVSFDRAYALYANDVLLWNAARAHHLAGSLVRARERYLACLGLPELPVARREKAARFLVDVELELHDREARAGRAPTGGTGGDDAFSQPLPGSRPSRPAPGTPTRRPGNARLATGADLEAQAPDDAAGMQPLPYSDRPLVLPSGTLSLGAGVGAGQFSGTGFLGVNAAVAFGLTEDVEIGASFLPLQLAPSVAYDLPSLYGQIRAQEGDYEVGVSMELLMGVRSNSAWIFSVGSPTILRAGDIFRINTGGYLDFVFSNPLGVNFRLPFDMAFNVLPELYLAIYTGWILPRFDFQSFTVPLGVGAGYTFANDEGAPFVDLIGAFRWPLFISLANPDTVDPETIQVTVSARFYFYL